MAGVEEKKSAVGPELYVKTRADSMARYLTIFSTLVQLLLAPTCLAVEITTGYPETTPVPEKGNVSLCHARKCVAVKSIIY